MSAARVVPASAEAIAHAAEILRGGGLVAFPTETVYGLGADATSGRAVARIFAAKARPSFNPLIIHVRDAETAARHATLDARARALARRFWPGPLTLVLAKRGDSPLSALALCGLETVALRSPGHPVARDLLAAADRPIAAPSANRSGQLSPTTAGHVADGLGDAVDLILDGGPTPVGIESTILDLSGGNPALLRPGAVSAEALEHALGVAVSPADSGAPRASGMLERHYAPKTRARLVPAYALDAEIAKLGARVAVLAFSRPDERVEYWLRMPREPDAYARRLYAALRELDSAECDEILIEVPPDESAWRAVRDRLQRAASRA